MTDLERLIHEPARLVLMANLYVVDEADFVYLARQTGLTSGNISSHMAKLEAASYVSIEKAFSAVFKQWHRAGRSGHALIAVASSEC